MNFKIGQELKCIKNHGKNVVIKDNTYILLGFQSFCSHYPIVFNVNNEETEQGGTICEVCGKMTNGVWVSSTLFMMPQEKEESKTEYKVVEIDKSLKEKREEVIYYN